MLKKSRRSKYTKRVVVFNNLNFLILSFILILISGCDSSDSGNNILAADGNTIFYNSPAVTKTNEHIYLGYLTSDGMVMVSQYSYEWKLIKKYLVHDYSNKIRNTPGGNKADDHAAPAINYNASTGEILLATAYHGTDLHIYRLNRNEQSFDLHKTVKGDFSYPNIIESNGNNVIFIRKMYRVNNIWKGDLVSLSSSDNFVSHTAIIESNNNQVIYSSKPFYDLDSVYFTWSIHDYDIGYLDGWYFTKYNLISKQNETVDLSYLVDGYVANRPTAVSVKNNKILLGTSFFIKEEYSKKQENFNRENRVMLISLDANRSVTIEHESKVLTPYYGVDIDIDKNLNYVFFDKKSTYYNGKIINCFEDEIKMYPILFDNLLIYSMVNGSYRIRDFDNSLKYCALP